MPHNTLSTCKMSKGHISNILGTVLFLKLKLTVIVLGDVELTRRQYLHLNAAASTPTTDIITTVTVITTTAATTTTKPKAITMNSTATANLLLLLLTG